MTRFHCLQLESIVTHFYTVMYSSTALNPSDSEGEKKQNKFCKKWLTYN